MAFKLNGNPLPVDVAFTVGTGEDAVNYPANWLRLSTADEKTALGITEVADDPSYDQRFYNQDGTEKTLTDVNDVDENGDPMLDDNGDQTVSLGVKSQLKRQEKQIATTYIRTEYQEEASTRNEKRRKIYAENPLNLAQK